MPMMRVQQRRVQGRVAWCVCVAIGLVAPMALGQPDPLAGPQGANVAKRATLVEIDYAGRLKPPEGTIEEAALRLLDVNDATRAGLDVVLQERARLMDELVSRNLRTLIRLGSASESGRKIEAMTHAISLWEKGRAIREKGSLRSRLAAELDAAQRRRFSGLIEEYLQAARRDGVEPGGKPKAWIEVVLQERFRGLSSEVERSFARQSTNGEEETDAFFDGLGLSPEQTQHIRQTFENFVLERGFSPTQGEQALVAAQVLAYLDEDARQRVIERFADQEAANKKVDAEMLGEKVKEAAMRGRDGRSAGGQGEAKQPQERERPAGSPE